MMNPGPNNRALTTGGDDPKGGAILKITFAGLLSCNGENKLPKCALPHRPNCLRRAILYTGQSILPSPPTVPHELCSRAQVPCTPVVADSGRAAPCARLFHFSEWICISQNFSDRRARAGQKKGPGDGDQPGPNNRAVRGPKGGARS
jgi:hypothetical protein